MGYSAIHWQRLAEQVVEQLKVVAACRFDRTVGGAVELQSVVKLLAHGHDWGPVKRHGGDVPAIFLDPGWTRR